MVRFDGGWVVRRDRSFGNLNTYVSPNMTRAAEDWYEQLFVRLARRLRYPGNKNRNARRRLTKHWGSQGVPEALAYVRDLQGCGRDGQSGLIVIDEGA
jgi:hypothetical protein